MPTTTPSTSSATVRACSGVEMPKPAYSGHVGAGARPLDEVGEGRGDLAARAGRAGDRDDVEPAVGVRGAEVGCARRSRSARRAGCAAARVLVGRDVDDDRARRAGGGRVGDEALVAVRLEDRGVRHRHDRCVDAGRASRRGSRGTGAVRIPPDSARSEPRANRPAPRRAGRRTGCRARGCRRRRRPRPRPARACRRRPSGRSTSLACGRSRSACAGTARHLGEILVAAAGQADERPARSSRSAAAPARASSRARG